MAEPTIQLGGGNWAGKSDNLLGYYKEGERFYKQDFTFSRSTTGTYTDSDGYIQEMPYNLLAQSSAFDNAYWTKSNSSVVGGFTSPDGTANAFKLVENTSTSAHNVFRNSSTVTLAEYSFSCFVKTNGRNVKLDFFGGTNNAIFNLTTGVVISTNGIGLTAKIETLSNGWYRCSINQLQTSTTIYPNILCVDGSNNSTYTGNGSSGIYIYGAQLNKGTSAKTYFPTTTRLNMPRVSYLNNSNGSLILEPQRTNVFIESNDYTGWNGYQATSNTTTAPDGSSVLFLDFEDVRMFPTTTISSATEYTSSIYLKANKVADVKLRNARNEDTIISLTTNWVRYELTATSNATSTNALLIDARFSQGLGASGLEIALFGGQIEQSSYATTYIPTSGSSVTRNADTCSISNVADRIGQTEGTLFVEAQVNPSDQVVFCLHENTTNNNRLLISFNPSTNSILFFSEVSGVNQTTISFSVPNIADNYVKVAYKYAPNNSAFFINGVKVGEDLICDTYTGSTLSRFSFANATASSPFYGNCKDLRVYNTALTDAELITLTT